MPPRTPSTRSTRRPATWAAVAVALTSCHQRVSAFTGPVLPITARRPVRSERAMHMVYLAIPVPEGDLSDSADVLADPNAVGSCLVPGSNADNVMTIIEAASDLATPFSGDGGDIGGGSDDSNGGGGGGEGEEEEDDENALQGANSMELERREGFSTGSPRKQKQNFGEWYKSMNVHHPLVTRSVTMGLTYALADTTAQLIELAEGPSETSLGHRVQRTIGITAIGLVFVGPLLTVWFNALDKFVPGSTFLPIAGRTALDQLIEAPIMIGSIFGLATLAEGGSVADAKFKLETKLLPTWRDGLIIWVPSQCINQAIVPLKYRVMLQAILSYFWDTYLSVVNHHAPRADADAAAPDSAGAAQDCASIKAH